jgi:TonB family protein
MIRTLLWVAHASAVYSLPFKGRARVGMGYRHVSHPPPNLPLEGGGEDHQRHTALRVVAPTQKPDEPHELSRLTGALSHCARAASLYWQRKWLTCPQTKKSTRMKIYLLLPVLALGVALRTLAADGDTGPAAAPCKQCTSAPPTAEALSAGRERTSLLAQTLEPKPGWQHATDALAVEALEVELMRNVGKQTQEADYPEEARRWIWSGTTLVHVLMGGDGHMKEVSVQRTSGFRVLDDQALKMVQRVQSTRVPDRLKGREVPVTLPIGFYFGR